MRSIVGRAVGPNPANFGCPVGDQAILEDTIAFGDRFPAAETY